MFALVVAGQEMSTHKTLSQAMDAARSAPSFPALVMMHGAILAELKAPVAKPAPAPRKKRPTLVLVERTDADAQYDFVGEIAAAKVWVDENGASPVKAKGGSVCAALTLVYQDKPFKQDEPMANKAPKKKLDKSLDAFIKASAKPAEPAQKLTTPEKAPRKAKKAPPAPPAETPAEPTPEKAPKAPRKAKAFKDPIKPVPETPAEPTPPAPPAEEPDMPLPAGVTEPELTPEQKLTREQWLLRVTRDHCTDLFAKAGADLPSKVRMSCGWPSTRAMLSKTGRVLGQCWRPEASSDGHFEIFITPALDNAGDVIGTLVHELVHACMPQGEGHGRKFRELALGVGLEGKMTATVPGAYLKTWTEKVVAEVGAYPHAKLDMTQQKKQTTRMLKVVCVNEECDFLAEEEKPYTVRMSAGVFDAGKPCCGVCRDRMEIAPEKQK